MPLLDAADQFSYRARGEYDGVTARTESCERAELAAKSCHVLESLGPRIQWLQSYVTDDKLFCVYIAPDPELIRAHAVRGGFPADAIREVKTIIDPTTAE